MSPGPTCIVDIHTFIDSFLTFGSRYSRNETEDKKKIAINLILVVCARISAFIVCKGSIEQKSAHSAQAQQQQQQQLPNVYCVIRINESDHITW